MTTPRTQSDEERRKSELAATPSPETLAMAEPVTDATPAGTPTYFEYFRVVKVLGEGGMGTVYLAHDTRLDRPVALKTLKREVASHPVAKDRFFREARSAALLEHDHIVPIYYIGESAGIPFLAMPYLQGEPLDQRIRRVAASGRLIPVPEVIRVARQVASGLALAHSKGFVHRDIKPANVWLEAPTGRVKLLDFGLARSQREQVNLTASGAIVGTPAYMAPEQARGFAIDARADLFSLGCVMYEMLAGRRPFTGADTMAILTSLALDTPRPPHELNPSCPAHLSQLTTQLLAKSPDQRPPSAQAVVDVLTSFETPTTSTTTVMAPNPWADIDVPEAEPVAEPPAAEPASPRRSRAGLYTAVGLLALAPLVWLLAGYVLRVETENGTLVVEVNDPAVEARIKNGRLILSGADGKDLYTLAAGERSKAIEPGPYKVRVEGADGLKLDTPEFTLAKGGKVTVRVTAAPKVVAKGNDAPRAKVDPKGSEPPVGFVPPRGGQAVSLLGGKDLAGWATEKGVPGNWRVVDGAITCSGAASHLYTDAGDYGDFHLRAEVKINAEGNSGIYFRSGKPLKLVGDYEAQISNRADQQNTGGLYNLTAVNKSLVPPPDTWFTLEVVARGDFVQVLVNGRETARYTDTRPDRRKSGYIALQHHDPKTQVYFRKIEVTRLGGSPAGPRQGWAPLFNGTDLTGWKATPAVQQNWKVEGGVLHYLGARNGGNLVTERGYQNFELVLDWKVEPGCDTGVYLRGQPQVQIWEESHPPSRGPNGRFPGSGGLYNNPPGQGKEPLVVADRPAGEWNTLEIRMVNGNVTVELNDKVVVNNVPMMPGKLPPEGPIELQGFGGKAWFRNIRLRELDDKGEPVGAATN